MLIYYKGLPNIMDQLQNMKSFFFVPLNILYSVKNILTMNNMFERN